MGWIKLDDRFLDHQKFLTAGPLAGYLHVAAIAWSNQNRTDGVIPVAQVDRLVNWAGIAETAQMDLHVRDEDVRARPVIALVLASDLVDCGLWEVMANGDFAIHDYLDWQTPATDIGRLSQTRSAAGKKGAKARWQNGKPVANVQQTDSKALAKPLAEGRRKKEELQTTSVEHGSTDAVKEVFDYWRDRCEHPQAKLTTDRAAKIKARLRDGYSLTDLRAAIDGAKAGAFVNADNGRRYDDIELICRNGSKLESFVNRTGATSELSSAEWLAKWNGEPA